MASLFISYDRTDRAEAQRIYDTLRNRPDIEPWLDVKRLRLVEFDPEIRRLIEDSSYVIALISEASLSSPRYVTTEWAYAQEKRKRVLPVLLDRSLESRSEVPALLERVTRINWVPLYESFDDGMRKILREVYGDLAGGTFRETFSSLGSDRQGWQFDGWKLDDDDAENANSQSLMAKVAPSFSSQQQMRVATIPILLGSWSRFAYARKLVLHRANMTASARFQVTLSDGSHTVPIEDVALTGARLDYSEDWRQVEQPLDLTRFRRGSATLRFALEASDMIPIPLTNGRAQVDNIRID